MTIKKSRWGVLLGLLCLGLGSSPSGLAADDTPSSIAIMTLPAMPEQADQARVLIAELPAWRARLQAHWSAHESACYQRVLISNCLEHVRGGQSAQKAELRRIEQRAKELVRRDDFLVRQRQYENKQEEAVQQAPQREAERQERLRKQQEKIDAASRRLPPDPSPRIRVRQPDTPMSPGGSLTPAQEAENRQRYEQKQKDHAERVKANQARLEKLQAEREIKQNKATP